MTVPSTTTNFYDLEARRLKLIEAPQTTSPSSLSVMMLNEDGDVVAVPMSSYVAYLSSVLGTGTGGDPEVPPELPPSASFNVPENRPDGAIIAHVNPLQPEAPTATWTMTPYTGLDILADSGDVYLVSAAAFFTAIGTGTATITLTATNSAGTATTDITFTAVPDYEELPSDLNANLIMNFDMLDNRGHTYDSVTGLLTALSDNSNEARDGANADPNLISYVLSSNLGVGKPSIRGNGSTGPTSGMFFSQNPVWRGFRSIGLVTSAGNDTVGMNIDQMYRNGSSFSPNQSALQAVSVNFTKNALLNQVCLLTLIADGDTLTYRLNGTEIGTLTLNSYNQPQYPIVAFVLFYATGITTSGSNQITDVSSVGQGHSWKGSAFNGDICHVVQYLNVVVA